MKYACTAACQETMHIPWSRVFALKQDAQHNTNPQIHTLPPLDNTALHSYMDDASNLLGAAHET